MAEYKVYVTRNIPTPGLDLLAQHFEITSYECDDAIPHTTLVEALKEKPYDALYCMLTDTIDAEVLDAAVTLSLYTNQRKLCKRGKKGGVRVYYRRKALKPPLPAIMTGIAGLDELSTNTRFLSEYREAGLICITETWFTENCPDSGINIDGFSVYRSDRTAESGKTRGGGVCAYINNKWCNNNNTHVTERTCTQDMEVLSLSLRPYYLPREFPKVNLNVVYAPPQANAKRAEDYLSNLIHEQQNKSPDSAILITGDFNHSTLESSLPTFLPIREMLHKKREDFRFVLWQRSRRLP
ncbi:hypothetical protein EGW08_005433 [Elysia chlorotica]|uniref:Endonuclease/exonuclease/phosphatase domain-containing protein n=1 Tax=Elysia chlorotica TaxID=188477 RepID=A0A433TYX4_ELYCH|nr:hypothetical protein EGW08_005433 [Elysia chlorotica]